MPFKSSVKQNNLGDLLSSASTFELQGFEDYPEAGEKGPFSDLGDCVMNESGIANDEHGKGVGILVEGNLKKLVGRIVKEDGDIVDEHGNVVGHAEPYEEAEQEIVDKSPLENKVVNGLGQVVDEYGTILGRIAEGDIKELSGKKVDGKGQIWEDGHRVIGQAELLPGIELPKLRPKNSKRKSGLSPALTLPAMPVRRQASAVKAAYDDRDSEDYQVVDPRAHPLARRDVLEAQEDARRAEGEDAIAQDSIDLGLHDDVAFEDSKDEDEYEYKEEYDPADTIGGAVACRRGGSKFSKFSKSEQGDPKLEDMELVDRLVSLWTTVKPL